MQESRIWFSFLSHPRQISGIPPHGSSRRLVNYSGIVPPQCGRSSKRHQN
jgi:hypothetical protein